jgi:molecular chaperone HscB
MSEPIPLRFEPSTPVVECRTCGAGSPVHEHFCSGCSRILSLGRHGDYFSFLDVPRRLNLDVQDLERRFRDLSRQLHPDYFYNATSSERLASLERSSYLNDAFRTLRNPVTRIEHLLALEGLSLAATDGGHATVPPGLLEEVFELNEQLDEIREARESGAAPADVRVRLDAAKAPIEARRGQHEQRVADLCSRWDALSMDTPATEKRAVLEALRQCVLERNYINNLIATIDREAQAHG